MQLGNLQRKNQDIAIIVSKTLRTRPYADSHSISWNTQHAWVLADSSIESAKLRYKCLTRSTLPILHAQLSEMLIWVPPNLAPNRV